MRRYHRIFFFLVITVMVLVLFVPRIWSYSARWLAQMKTSHSQLDQTTNSLVYFLNEDKWLNFDVQKSSKKLRLITNADVSSELPYIEDANWRYVLQYQLLNSDGVVVEDVLYHQRSHLTTYESSDHDSYHANSYLGEPKTVLDGRLITLSLEGLSEIVKVRVKLSDHDPEIRGVAVRLYEPTKIADHRLATLWLRLSVEQKERLAEGTVYKAALLTEYEKTNLLRSQWKAVGPAGIEGEDYVVDKLFSLRGIGVGAGLDESLYWDGLVGSGQPLVVAIPEEGGDLHLSFNRLDGRWSENDEVTLNWFGRTADKRWTQKVVLNNEKREFNIQVEGGLLKVSSEAELAVKANLTLASGKIVDVSYHPVFSKNYQLMPSIEFQVLHVGGEDTVVKLDVRRHFRESFLPVESELSYQCFDAHDQQVCSGSLPVPNDLSEYDRLGRGLAGERVSDPAHYYLTLSDEVARLKVSSERVGVMVAAYNQPFGLAKQLRVPEDSFVNVESSQWDPAWFALQPNNLNSLLDNQKAILVYGQYKPSEGDPDIESGNYLWQDYVPTSHYKARYILTNFESKQVRDEVLPNLYCELKSSEEMVLDFQSSSGQHSMMPELMFNRAEGGAFGFSLQLDGETVVDREEFGRQGRIRLPSMRAGKHTLHFKGARALWLINHSQSCARGRFLKRRVFGLDSKLSFTYEHREEDELLSGRFYVEKGERQRARLKVTLTPLSEKKDQREMQVDRWTFLQRYFDIRADQSGDSRVLFTEGSYLNTGQQFFIPIKQDLVAGMYRVDVEKLSGPAGFLALSKVTPGAHESSYFYRERAGNDE